MNTYTAVNGLLFLRPYLLKPTAPIKHAHNVVYLRLFHTTRHNRGTLKASLYGKGYKSKATPKSAAPASLNLAPDLTDVEFRTAVLKDADALSWPRVINSHDEMTIAEFLAKHKDMSKGQINNSVSVTVRGRVRVCRIAGKNLAFFDLVHDYLQLQVVINLRRLVAFGGVEQAEFKDFFRLLQRGDIVSVCGNPYVTETGEMSINCAELPVILSPALASIPKVLEDPMTRIKNRHLDLLVNRQVADRLRVRSHIVQTIRNFLLDDHFLEVQTPLIADKASGAIAKPFKTVATEFSDKELALRIAPELWLKRLVIGGMERVFEIGPAFRNEGLDATHNPEFTTCEFYRSFTDLESLMKMTEDMLTKITEKVVALRAYPLRKLPEFDQTLVATPFNRIEFIPGVEKGLGHKLPDLAADDATTRLIELFKQHSHPLPSRPTLPRLLDRLASIHIEPSCTSATFIMYHPACMAPLAKSFICPATKQLVSARAELFIQNSEIANMYEEENSPIEQRAKFVQQGRFVDEENEGYVDESYIKALESGLPPTGGWGAGVDRIVMLFSGTKRIADVLSFGSLRNVVYLGSSNPLLEGGEGEGSKSEENEVKEEVGKLPVSESKL